MQDYFRIAMLDEDIWDMEYKSGKFPTGGILMGAIVTASGTGAEMNAGAVITCEDKRWKGPLFGIAATFAALNPSYTMSAPKIQVLSGVFDTLSHAMETYLGTSDQDNVSDNVALAIMRNTVVNMRRVLVDIEDVQARANLMWDYAMAENGILKVGRLTDFQAHQIEHPLGAYTDCNHGQGFAVIQPVYYRHILTDAREKFTRFAKSVFEVETAEKGLDALEAFIKECGLPTKLSELQSKVEITEEILRQVADTCNIIKSNPRELDKEEVYPFSQSASMDTEQFDNSMDFVRENAKGITPIHIDDEVSSLSAILLNDDYYKALLNGKEVRKGLSVLRPEYIILFKAKAYLDLQKRKDLGEKVDSDDIKKHKKDVMRIASELMLEKVEELPIKLVTGFCLKNEQKRESMPCKTDF